MKSLVCRVAVACFAVIALVASSPASPNSDIVAHVGGGGTGSFDDPRFEGLTTQFGMGVNILSDGSAKGNFECLVTGVLALHVMAVEGTLNEDGSVTFSGPGIVHFAGGGSVLDVFTVHATAGGPGIGTFCLAPPTFPDTDCDAETVTKGGIMIITP